MVDGLSSLRVIQRIEFDDERRSLSHGRVERFECFVALPTNALFSPFGRQRNS